MPEKILIEWQAPEFRPHPKTLDWFFGVGLVSLGLAIWAIYTLNLLFLLVILAGTVALFIFAAKEPKIYRFFITSSGIGIERNFTTFQSLDSFWIFNFPDAKILSLKPKARLLPGTHIVLPEKNATNIKNILSQYLPEEEEHYSFADRLADYFRF
jgi:hypothetical protein